MSTLKILSDTSCTVKCDFQEVGNIQVGELFKLHLKKGCYILEFLVEDIVIFSMDYTIETNDEEPLLRLSIKEQAEKKIRERNFAYVFSEDGRSIWGCNTWFEGDFIVPEGIERIAGYAFRECHFTSVNIPNSVKSIGDYAFILCRGLTSVTIPNSVTSIGAGAFSGCSALTSITIPNSVTSIVSDVFFDCLELTNIVVEEGNTKFDSRNNCNAIIETSSNTLITGCKNTTIPNSVTSIGVGAFQYCSGLTFITIPNSVTSIGDSAFSGCSGLTSVVIPNSVTSIGERAFDGCSGLTSITIPNSVTSIGYYAFDGCSGLTSVVIPNSVTTIYDYAFLGCSGLTMITIPNTVTFIGYGAFYGCSGLTSIVVEEGNTEYDSRNNCNAIIESSSNTLIAGCKNTIIPNSVTAIDGYAFYRCNGLTSITIPNSVTSIGDDAFSGCGGLISIVVEEGNAKYDSRNNCNAIIETSSNTLIIGCKNTTIPNSVTSIGKGAFSECSALTSITIPNCVTSIGDWAFYGCSGLTSVTIPNSVTSIGDSAFSGCSGLTSVVIPNSVTSIGERAFDGCSGLTSVVIPNSVTSIGNSAFVGCVNLKEIIILKGTREKFEEMLPYQKNKLVEYEQLSIKRTKDNRTFFFFDTETTGVPLNYKAPSSDTNNWPRLVQLAWILTDEEGNRIHTGNLIVKPEGFTIPTDATRVHGITTQRANEEGVPLAEVIEQFNADLDVANYIVGHNIDFDIKIVGAEMIRLGLKDIMDSKKSYCTMQSSIDFCKIPGKYGYKYPKLQELYKKLFGTEFDNAHDAMSDIEATEKCFWELKKRKLI